MMYYVYQYINPLTQLPFYIGKGKGNRLFKHLYETYDNTENKKKYSIIQHLRIKGFEPIIEKIQDDLCEDDAYNLEETLIKKYGRRDIDPGGILTNICLSSRPPVLRGAENPRTGKPLHPQIIEKIKKTKESIKGKTLEEIYGDEKAQIIRSRCSQKGEQNGFFGKTHSTETRQKMKEKAKNRIPRSGWRMGDEQKSKVRLNNKYRKPIHTPYGEFLSVGEFVEKWRLVSIPGLHNILLAADQPLSKNRVDRCKLFETNQIGKTPRQLGWYYK